MSVKFPNITVQLTGEDGNAFFIIGRVGRALRKGGATKEEIADFTEDAMSGDYNHVLTTVMEWVNVE